MSDPLWYVHPPGSRVRLKTPGIPATVACVFISPDCVEYRVVWWEDGCRKIETVYEWELAEGRGEAVVGFHNGR